jgi:hypothetical protein
MYFCVSRVPVRNDLKKGLLPDTQKKDETSGSWVVAFDCVYQGFKAQRGSKRNRLNRQVNPSHPSTHQGTI